MAEKPSVARALASVFQTLSNGNGGNNHNNNNGNNNGGNGPRSAAPLFTSHNVCFPNIFSQALLQGGRPSSASASSAHRPHTMITTSVRGHLATQDFPKEYG